MSTRQARASFQRGVAHYRAGRLTEARQCMGEAVTLDEKFADAHHALGLMALEAGDAAAAVPCLRRATECGPGKAGYFANLAVALRRLKQYAEAIDACDQALALEPQSPAVLNNRGNIQRDTGSIAEALADYERAIALKPDYAEAHRNRALLLQKTGRLEEALAALAEAIRLRPDYAEAWNCRGNVLRDLGRWDDAVAEYDRAIAVGAGSAACADAHYNRSVVVRDQGDGAGASADLRAALALRLDYVEAHWAYAFSVLTPVYPEGAAMVAARAEFAQRFAQLESDCRADAGRLAEWEPAVGSAQPFYLAYHGINEREAVARYGTLVCDVMGAWHTGRGAVPPAPGPRAGERRIRLGIVSSQFHRHSVWDVITRGMITQLDPSQFEVTCYHVGWRRDRETAVARKAAAQFVMGPKSLADWVTQLEQDRQDVLIYPEIGMDPMTVKLAGLRLAPLQCVAWGHPVTSGLPTMDYYLSGDLLEPPGAERNYTEALVRLPRLGCYFEPLTLLDGDAGDTGTTGSSAERDGVTRFICCGQLAKYHPDDDNLYVRIAREAGPCRFTFVELGRTHGAWERFRARIEARFREAGLDPATYLEFLPTLPRREFLALLAGMDVYLDAPSFSGFTTAIQALSCRGLPVVTLAGELMRQRLAAEILAHIGVTETVVRDRDGYLRCAVRLARDVTLRAELRARINTGLPLAYRDSAVIRALEDFLVKATRGNRPG